MSIFLFLFSSGKRSGVAHRSCQFLRSHRGPSAYLYSCTSPQGSFLDIFLPFLTTRNVPNPPSRLRAPQLSKHTNQWPTANSPSRGILSKELNYKSISMVVKSRRLFFGGPHSCTLGRAHAWFFHPEPLSSAVKREVPN